MRFMSQQNLNWRFCKVLWEHGPSTVRFVNDQLNKLKREVQYTSTLKLMQIMADKGLLTRNESQMKHIYSVVEEEIKRGDSCWNDLSTPSIMVRPAVCCCNYSAIKRHRKKK